MLKEYTYDVHHIPGRESEFPQSLARYLAAQAAQEPEDEVHLALPDKVEDVDDPVPELFLINTKNLVENRATKKSEQSLPPGTPENRRRPTGILLEESGNAITITGSCLPPNPPASQYCTSTMTLL